VVAVRTVEDAHDILTNGGDRVAVNTAAVENPEFIRKALRNLW